LEPGTGTVGKTPTTEIACTCAACKGKAAIKVVESPPTVAPRAPHLQNLLFNVLTSHKDLAPTIVQSKDPFQFFIQPLLKLIFEFAYFLLIHHVDPRLQKRLQIFHR
jgi:hypothetical protein